MTDFLYRRGDHFYYKRRVPAHLRKYDSRAQIKISLKTRDPVEARRRALIQNEWIEKFWRDLISNPRTARKDDAYREAVATARVHGFAYKNLADVAEGSLVDIVERVMTIREKPADGRKQAKDALLGGVNKPTLPVSSIVETYFDLCADRLMGKSADFIRKWKNPRKRAASNFIAAVGDKSLTEITRRDILDFKNWWLARISAQKMTPDTATKDIIHLKDLLRVVARDAEINLDITSLFADLTFRSQKTQRASFEADFVQNTILATGALDDLNDEARCLVWYMADTGARVSEIVGLLPEDVFLTEKIPFLWIRPNKKRTLKTPQSERQIPLVGFALKAALELPEGLPRYHIADSVSGLVNQYFENHGLKPSENHTLYSLRHTFKDRLRDIGAPEEVIDNLMGHASRGPKYGRGHTLETKMKWMQQIAFKAPL